MIEKFSLRFLFANLRFVVCSSKRKYYRFASKSASRGINRHDIGNYIETRFNTSDSSKSELLQKPWLISRK